MKPRTKHINISYHRFREQIRLRTVQLFPISTKDQLADINTKPLPRDRVGNTKNIYFFV